MGNDVGVYRVEMDSRWDLEDLYEFPHAFMQVYAFAYSFDTELSPRDADRINDALETYPWGGGYSIVNIYTVLQNQIVREYRPQIAEIQYASPGWIDLVLNLETAVKVAGSVAAIAGSMAATTKAYASIQKSLQSISLQREQSKLKHYQLTRAQVQELTALNKELAEMIGFERLDELTERTKSVEVASKLLAAQFRRLKKIAVFKEKNKATLPLHPKQES